MSTNILSILIFFPLILSLPILFFRKENSLLIKVYSLAISIATFLISLYLIFKFDISTGEFQFVEKVPWVKIINANYFVGLDGISLMMVMLTTFMMPLCLIASFNTIKLRIKEYFFLMLLMEGALIGVFVSLDLILFYLFWEFILIPMYFLIGIWGGENRVYATLKFFIYTAVGSLLLLIGIIWVGNLVSAPNSFTSDFVELTVSAPTAVMSKQIFLFVLFTLSFLIKVPLFPFHTWLPDAHVQAPTAGSVILASLLLKMGAYGILRFSLSLFPAAFAFFTPYLAVLAVIGIIYGALLSIVQKDMKKLVAYSSVSHMGFIILGITALTVESLQGSLIQMVNHGLSTGALFLIVGMFYERRHTKEITEYGGLRKVMPWMAAIFLIVSLSSIGLPGLNGFVGEFLILVGSFGSPHLGSAAYTVIATAAVILAAIYLLWLYQRVMLGPLENDKNKSLKDLTASEYLSIIPILVFIFWIGVQPNAFLKYSENTMKKITTTFEVSRMKVTHEEKKEDNGERRDPVQEVK